MGFHATETSVVQEELGHLSTVPMRPAKFMMLALGIST